MEKRPNSRDSIYFDCVFFFVWLLFFNGMLPLSCARNALALKNAFSHVCRWREKISDFFFFKLTNSNPNMFFSFAVVVASLHSIQRISASFVCLVSTRRGLKTFTKCTQTHISAIKSFFFFVFVSHLRSLCTLSTRSSVLSVYFFSLALIEIAIRKKRKFFMWCC